MPNFFCSCLFHSNLKTQNIMEQTRKSAAGSCRYSSLQHFRPTVCEDRVAISVCWHLLWRHRLCRLQVELSNIIVWHFCWYRMNIWDTRRISKRHSYLIKRFKIMIKLRLDKVSFHKWNLKNPSRAFHMFQTESEKERDHIGWGQFDSSRHQN